MPPVGVSTPPGGPISGIDSIRFAARTMAACESEVIRDWQQSCPSLYCETEESEPTQCDTQIRSGNGKQPCTCNPNLLPCPGPTFSTMSSVKSRVKRALSDEQTRSGAKGTSSSTGRAGPSTSETERTTSGMTSEELTEAVKQGLTEALEERAEMKQEGEMTSQESTKESESSRRGPSMKGMLLLGALAAIGIIARRRFQSGGSDEYGSGQSSGFEDEGSDEVESDVSDERHP